MESKIIEWCIKLQWQKAGNIEFVNIMSSKLLTIITEAPDMPLCFSNGIIGIRWGIAVIEELEIVENLYLFQKYIAEMDYTINWEMFQTPLLLSYARDGYGVIPLYLRLWQNYRRPQQLAVTENIIKVVDDLERRISSKAKFSSQLLVSAYRLLSFCVRKRIYTFVCSEMLPVVKNMILDNFNIISEKDRMLILICELKSFGEFKYYIDNELINESYNLKCKILEDLFIYAFDSTWISYIIESLQKENLESPHLKSSISNQGSLRNETLTTFLFQIYG